MASDTLTTRGPKTDTISGLDALEIASQDTGETRAGRLWAATWPKVAALALVLAAWQLTVWSGWKDPWALPGPMPVFQELWSNMQTAELWQGIATTGRRAAFGFAAALTIGLLVGLAVVRSTVLRAAIGSMITSLQTMPSIAWFPLAILLFQLSEKAIFLVVVLGAAPSIANGVIHGVDYVPPLLLRAGHNIGARGIHLYRHVIGPAALPAIVAGLKQGWAFSWRSLMAGELLVLVVGTRSIGVNLDQTRFLADYPGLYSTMMLVLIIGILVDAVGFGTLERGIRRRRGLLVS
jgi:NitT/TauT family transport system permease protein